MIRLSTRWTSTPCMSAPDTSASHCFFVILILTREEDAPPSSRLSDDFRLSFSNAVFATRSSRPGLPEPIVSQPSSSTHVIAGGGRIEAFSDKFSDREEEIVRPARGLHEDQRGFIIIPFNLCGEFVRRCAWTGGCWRLTGTLDHVVNAWSQNRSYKFEFTLVEHRDVRIPWMPSYETTHC